MTTQEWLLVVAAWLVPIGGMIVGIFRIREAASTNLVRIGNIEQRLSRGDEHFDQVYKQLNEVNASVSRIETKVAKIDGSLEWLKRNSNGKS